VFLRVGEARAHSWELLKSFWKLGRNVKSLCYPDLSQGLQFDRLLRDSYLPLVKGPDLPYGWRLSPLGQGPAISPSLAEPRKGLVAQTELLSPQRLEFALPSGWAGGQAVGL
jgi:hypothetical protein